MNQELSDPSTSLEARLEHAIEGLRERFDVDAIGLFQTQGNQLELVTCSGSPRPQRMIPGAKTTLARRGGYGWSEIEGSSNRLWEADGLSIDTPIPGVDETVGILSIFVSKDRLPEWKDPGRSNLAWLATRIGILIERRRADRDDTDCGHDTERLLATQKLAELGRLALAVAHDSNNLITAMAGSMQFLEEALEDHAHRELAANGLDAYRLFGDMMRHLTDFSRDQRLDADSLPLDDTLADLAFVLRTQLRGQITLRMELDAPQVLLTARKTQITQILLNLSSNAFDALGGRGMVTIRTSQVERDGSRWARLGFSDDGPGMTEEVRKHAFDPMFSTKAPDDGTGLGLLTVQQTVAQLRGRISVLTETEGGCHFEILLPAHTAPSPLIIEPE